MKKLISIVMAVMLLGVLAMSAAAAPSDHYHWGDQGVQAEFYLLKEGLPMPEGTASQPTKNYVSAGLGSIKYRAVEKGGIYNPKGVDDYLYRAPKVDLKDGQTVVWYVVKQEFEGWHVDGVVTPFCSVLYDPNGDGVMGETTDGVHYYKGDTATIQENRFSRKLYDFAGWNTAADGSGKTYRPGETLAFDEAFFSDPKNMSTVTLYAMWKKQATTDDDPQPSKNTVKGSIVCPKKMSVRFEDGTVYYGGESIDLEIGKEYKFQMCSNDWDTDTYTDDGHGICGTVVYTVRVSDRYDERSYDADTKTFVLPKGDPVLRTDVNKCFMAYRYHFKTDYNKQTGIKQVVNTPLESLSVNLPLGSTITSDAYIAYKQVGSADVFIENDEDLTISYTDYRWNY